MQTANHIPGFAGAITIDQALSRASVHGDPRVLTTVLGAAQT